MEERDDKDFPADADVDAVLYDFKGDAREAIRALLHDLAVLAADMEASASRGYIRGDLPRLLIKHEERNLPRRTSIQDLKRGAPRGRLSDLVISHVAKWWLAQLQESRPLLPI